MNFSSKLDDNISYLNSLFPINKSFDVVTRELFLGNTRAFLIGINGFCQTELLNKIISDLQNPYFVTAPDIDNLPAFVNSKIGYIQTQLSSDWQSIIKNILSGPYALFIDGFNQAIIIDTRTYPSRSVSEPDAEKVTKGARDGFVETLLSNTALIRRRIRNASVTFEMKSVGTTSKTDVAIGYIGDIVDKGLLDELNKKIDSLNITSLTMGAKSLEELLIKKRFLNPLPNIVMTERPDVVSSYLLEGHIAIVVDNSPTVLILPCTIFQFTQSPEDYYKSPAVGNYLRIIRFACIFVSLFLLPVFLYLGSNYETINGLDIITTGDVSPTRLFVYVLFIEFGLDLFKYSSAHTPSRFSNSLSIIGGLIISDVAISLNWATTEVIFYGAATMLATLSLANIEFGEAIRIYRIFLVLCTGFFDLYGLIGGTILVLISIITTPTFAGRSYFWPLYPFNWDALKTLLFRYPTYKAQPTKIWDEH